MAKSKPSTQPKPIMLHPGLVAELRTLNAQRKMAEERFMLAANGALLALGLDPQANNHMDLDTGVVTPAGKSPVAPPAGAEE